MRKARREKIMPSFYKLFLSIVGHVPAPRSFRMTHAASADAFPAKLMALPQKRLIVAGG